MSGMEGEIKTLLRGISQHINKLASGNEQNNPLPANQEESIIQKLTENAPHQEPIEEGNVDLRGLLTDNVLTQNSTSLFSSQHGEPRKEPTAENFLKDIKDVFGKTQSQGK
jgi:hypothetical protein